MQGRTGPDGSDANYFGSNLLDAAHGSHSNDTDYRPHDYFVANQVATKVTISPSATADRTIRTIVQRVLWRSRLCHRYRTNKELCIKESVGRAYELMQEIRYLHPGLLEASRDTGGSGRPNESAGDDMKHLATDAEIRLLQRRC